MSLGQQGGVVCINQGVAVACCLFLNPWKESPRRMLLLTLSARQCAREEEAFLKSIKDDSLLLVLHILCFITYVHKSYIDN